MIKVMNSDECILSVTGALGGDAVLVDVEGVEKVGVGRAGAQGAVQVEGGLLGGGRSELAVVLQLERVVPQVHPWRLLALWA